MKKSLLSATALVAIASFVQFSATFDAGAKPLVSTQPGAPEDIAPFIAGNAAPGFADRAWSDEEIAALRRDIKYVFVIFNENRSFDHQYGTFPGANGLFSDDGIPRAVSDTPGFTETYTDLAGMTVTVRPFRLGPAQNSTIHDSTDHSHEGLARKLDVQEGMPKMDKFAEVEYRKYAKPGNAEADAQGKQFAQLVMSYVDCDTVPFFWRWASRFTLFDNIFATEDTPSTPNAVAMIAGQSGETQWVKHPSKTADPTETGATATVSGTINNVTYTGVETSAGPPIVEDPVPWWGSQFDANATDREPTSPLERYSLGAKANVASNLTFSSLPLTMMGGQIKATTAQDRDAGNDLADLSADVPTIEKRGQQPVPWRWYQNGYDLEPNDSGGVASHMGYVAHHNGPQYFGYISANPVEQTNMRGEGDFFADIANRRLPAEGGVFYIRGGYFNLKYPQQTAVIQNLKYPNRDGLSAEDLKKIAQRKSGDDDHPAYSDSQLSESMAARAINAIAANKDIWEHSAIVITYDESDGLYDHVPPRILSYGPDKLPLARGIRIPLILISPYAKAHAISHAEGDHNAVIETINAIFGLPALSSLPDEADALKQGDSPAFNAFAPDAFHQRFLGPRDTESEATDSLLSGFDKARVLGTAPLLPASYAEIPDNIVESFPHYGGEGCKAIDVTPEDVRLNLVNPPPPGFNALPALLPKYN
jgi:phospholipase C